MEDKVILLDFWASPSGKRVKIALEEKKIKYECKEEKFPEKSVLLLESNPIYKQIPVLIHNGKPICGSLIILEYIDATWKDKFPLILPSDPYERAQARFWADFVETKLYTCSKGIWMKKGEEKEAAKAEFVENLMLLEGELGEKTFFGGQNMGLVDIALVPHNSWFYTYERYGNFDIESLCPKLVGWAKRCLKLSSVAKNLPQEDMIYDFVQNYKM